MKAYIIYHSDEAIKNASFIEMFKIEGKNYNIDFKYIPYEEYTMHVLPDIVLNRTRDFNVSKWYEDMGIKVIHSSHITYLGNNKYETFKYLQKNLCDAVKKEKWCANTKLIDKDEINAFYEYIRVRKCSKFDSTFFQSIVCYDGNTNFYKLDTFVDRFLEYENNEAIIKTVDGHGGNEVFLIALIQKEIVVKSPLITPLQMCQKLYGHRCIIQEKLNSNSSDLRVYILMGEIYAAVLRKGTNDFRSNYSLGGNVYEYNLSNAQRQYIQYFIDALGGKELFMAGIDFIITADGKLIFNELEEMVGSRMLYKCTDYDIVKDYVKRLANILT